MMNLNYTNLEKCFLRIKQLKNVSANARNGFEAGSLRLLSLLTTEKTLYSVQVQQMALGCRARC